MLVLSRKLDESIVIDGNIEVTVLAVHGRRVKLGVRAPGDVAIRRSEISPHANASDQHRHETAPRVTVTASG
jgi:carbon storage regulator